jgi:diapolycopene oxygenase
MTRIGIIGAGLGGLSAACTLAARGYAVKVFERNAWAGGKNVVLSEQGFRFDMGPTILIQPSVLRRIFAEAGEDLDREIPMTRLEPQWRSFFADGKTLDLCSETVAMETNLGNYAKGSAEGYKKFLAESSTLKDISDRWFFWRPMDSIWDTFDPKSVLQLSLLNDVRNMRLGKTVSGTVEKFVKDRHVAQMLEHFVQYVGSAPDNTPAILCAIAHMQTSEGVWYPQGGTAAVAQGLRKLAERLGVEFRHGVAVEKIAHKNGRVYALQMADGSQVGLDAMVSNADAVRTHTELLEGAPRKKFSRKNAEPACSGVVLYLGLKKRYEHLLHHNFVFSESSKEEFDSIYRRGVPAEDPTCYLCAPSATDSTVAPPGGEALYVLVHTPYLRAGQNWKQMFPGYRKVILEKLKRTAGLDDIESRIMFESQLTPQDIHDRYRVLKGAIYGIASHGRLNGGFKPGNISKTLSNLFLCGGAAHPGPGMPMVLMSGWIAADALDKSGCVRKAVAA